MEEAADVVGGTMDLSMHNSWLLDDLLNDDDTAFPYSDEGIGHGADSPELEVDFFTSTYKEIVDFMSAKYEQYKEKKHLYPPANDDAGLTRPDPWELVPPSFVTRKKFGFDEKTRRGYWKEKDNEFIAIRADQFLQPVQRSRPVFIGLERTLEFVMNDGTKTEWLMTEFAMIHESDDGHFFLKEEVVFTKVFKKDKDAVSCPPNDARNCPSGMANNGGDDQAEREDEPNRNNIASHHSRRGAAPRDQAPTVKRMRSDDDPNIRISESDVWQHFTKIYTQALKEVGSKRKDSKKLVYAVCHHCYRVFRASSKNGTSSLRRHAEGCQCKHLRQERARDIVLQSGPSGYAR